MTACTNKGGKAGRVITAALVATLSVGAPVVALATTADSGDAQLMAQTSKQAFADGTVTAQDGKGGDVTFPDKGILTFTGEGQYLLPTSIKVSGVDYELNLKSGTGNAKVEYFDSSNQPVAQVGKGITTNLAKNHDWTAGTYTAKITYLDEGSQYNNCTKTVQFKVVDASLEDATIFNATDGNTDTSVTGFTYNGGSQKIGLAIDDAVVDAADYKLEVYKGDTKVDFDKIKDAGAYTVYVKDNADKQVKTLNFTVAKLDLSSASVSVGDVQYVAKPGTMVAPTTITANGHKITGADVVITCAFTNDGTNNSMPGSYQATVTPNTSSSNVNVTGKAVVNFNVVTTKVADTAFKYGSKPFSNVLNINLSNGQSFDASKIKVTGVNADLVDVTYADASGAAVTAADLKAPGTYYVTARVNAELSEYKFGSDSEVLKVVVTAGQIKANDIVFKYNGEVTADLKVTYDGSDFAKGITSEVTVGDKKLEAGTDYELVILDESGKKVDSIVDAGDYKVEIKSDSYKLPNKGYSMTVKVSPIAITRIYADSALIRDFGVDGKFIPYTGEDIDAGFTFGYYTDADGDECLPTAEGATWNALPEGSVAIDGIKYQKDAKSTWSVVDGLKEKGFYQLYITLDPETAVNYKYNTGADGQAVTNVIEVSDDKVFVDVPSDAWYAESVYTASKEGYIFGVNNSKVFAPDASLSRADMVCVLYRMAGGTTQDDNWVGGDDNVSYLSKFSDVDAKAYYAQALAWASKTGVVTGYEDGTFGPSDPVTVEQFATMLARYAKVAGTDTTVDDVDAVLGSVADGAQVSDFARDAVAWAVDGGYLAQGSDIVPQSEVSRGRMITIAVRYQPEQLHIIGNW